MQFCAHEDRCCAGWAARYPGRRMFGAAPRTGRPPAESFRRGPRARRGGKRRASYVTISLIERMDFPYPTAGPLRDFRSWRSCAAPRRQASAPQPLPSEAVPGWPRQRWGHAASAVTASRVSSGSSDGHEDLARSRRRPVRAAPGSAAGWTPIRSPRLPIVVSVIAALIGRLSQRSSRAASTQVLTFRERSFRYIEIEIEARPGEVRDGRLTASGTTHPQPVY